MVNSGAAVAFSLSLAPLPSPSAALAPLPLAEVSSVGTSVVVTTSPPEMDGFSSPASRL
jgi:hypothetical protein